MKWRFKPHFMKNFCGNKEESRNKIKQWAKKCLKEKLDALHLFYREI